jgi:hypothetical protein
MTMQEKFHILLHNKFKNTMLLKMNTLIDEIEKNSNINGIKIIWNKCMSEWESIIEYESEIIKELCSGIKKEDIIGNDKIISLINREEYEWIWNIIKEIRNDAINIKKKKETIMIEISNGNNKIKEIDDAIVKCKNKGIIELNIHIEEMKEICDKHINIFHEMDEGLQMI